MKECEVEGVLGFACRGKDITSDGEPYCVLLEAASLETAKSIGDFESMARKNSERCPLAKTVFEYIEQKKLE